MAVTGVDSVMTNFRRAIDLRRENAKSAMEEIVEFLTEKAKQEHSFTNRTGTAEASIEGALKEISSRAVIGEVSAGGGEAFYAYYLELARSGQWAFLWPTIEAHKDDIIRILERHMKL